MILIFHCGSFRLHCSNDAANVY